jgi:alpha-mannosidase
LNAEKYSSLAWLGGTAYPQSDLNQAWKKVLFNEFHDLAAGTGIAAIYRDAQEDFQMVRSTADQATSQALGSLVSYIDTQTPPGTVPLLVFNPMAWKRSDVLTATVQMPGSTQGIAVHDMRDREIPVQVLSRKPETHTFEILLRAQDVPALGYEKLTVAPLRTRQPVSDLRTSGTTLENRYLRVVVDSKTGCITSIFDKQDGFEFIAAGACGNELQAFHDRPKAWDAWNIDPDYEQHPYHLGPAKSVQLIESGPLRAIVRVVHATALSKFVQDITLYAGIDRVDVANTIEWHEQHILVKAAFPLSSSGPTATYEIPYGTIERPTTRNNSFEKARFEVPALRWADLGDGAHGFSLINNCKYGYDAKGNVLRLTLLRSTVSPDPTADRGLQQFVYSLYPHSGDWKSALTERHAWDFNYELKALQPEKHSGRLPSNYSFIEVEPDNVILTAVKKAEDDNALILRLYEWKGEETHVKIHLPRGVKSAISTNLMEVKDDLPLEVSDRSIAVDVKPYSIDTLEVRFDGTGEKYWQQP